MILLWNPVHHCTATAHSIELPSAKRFQYQHKASGFGHRGWSLLTVCVSVVAGIHCDGGGVGGVCVCVCVCVRACVCVADS